MTREELIQAIYNDLDEWSCPNGNCDKYEQDNCMACVECQLAEYENKIRADAIDKFVNRMKKLVSNWFYRGVINIRHIDKIAEELKGEM